MDKIDILKNEKKIWSCNQNKIRVLLTHIIDIMILVGLIVILKAKIVKFSQQQKVFIFSIFQFLLCLFILIYSK